ncbi:MAG: hypothetical protein FWG56_09970 [Desulfovibrionaceae bacterium]|jgi:hypothetical protein|nr:hypothetical protein [Desulfovibrionaceae bacterium]
MEKETSYLGAMLTSQANLHVVLGAGALAALAAFPFGLVGAALPLLVLGVGEVIAGLVVPDLPSFRAKVDQDKRRVRRDDVRKTLLTELTRRIPVEVSASGLSSSRSQPLETADRLRMAAYNRMIEQIRALSSVARDGDSPLGEPEIERLHEAAIDFLSLWMARLVIKEREGASDLQDIRRKLAQIEQSLPNADRATVAQLRRAQTEYQGILDRHGALVGKTVAIDAALASMPDKIEEIYQMLIAAPYSKGIGDRLEDSLSRLRLADELEQELSLDLSNTLPSGVAFDHAGSNDLARIASKERARTFAQQTTINH